MSKDLIQKLMKAGKIPNSSLLSESPFFNQQDCVSTPLPILNIAFTGRVDGGLVSGITVFAGESKSFKTLLGLYCMKSYFDKYPDAVAVIYDSEFGITPAYLESMGIDTSRVIHCPIEHIEQLKFDIVQQLQSIKRGDKVFFFIDSLGALASKKEVDDVEEGKSTVDLTRAKQIRSLLRLITPHFSMKNLPCVIVNHVYKTMELYSKNVVGGGTSIMYSSNQIFIISKSQEKDGDDLVGWNFTINIEKSRFVRERSKLPFTVLHKGGIKPWSGLFDLALEGKFIVPGSKGWYCLVDPDTGEVATQQIRAKATESMDFWEPILNHPKFQEYVKNTFQVSANALVASNPDDDE